MLVAVIVASYAYSIVLTSANAQNAYFSPLTRSWELALGGLIAVDGRISGASTTWAALLTWLGLAAILVASFTLTSATVYPGWLVAIPILGAGLVIAGGGTQPNGESSPVRQRTFQFLGLISYLAVPVALADPRDCDAAPRSDELAGVGQHLAAPGGGVVAALTYWVLENPVRHSSGS